jgi:uncharacterized protein YbcI
VRVPPVKFGARRRHIRLAERPPAGDPRCGCATLIGTLPMLGGARLPDRKGSAAARATRVCVVALDGTGWGQMSERGQRSVGEMRAMISNEIVRLQAEYYGKGPTKAKTYIVDDLVVCVLEESFTRAEKTLVDRGEREAIQQIRRRFQQQMADEFIGVVEQATGRKVRTFLSETNLEHDVSVETFLLAEGRTDMDAFEQGARDVEAGT